MYSFRPYGTFRRDGGSESKEQTFYLYYWRDETNINPPTNTPVYVKINTTPTVVVVINNYFLFRDDLFRVFSPYGSGESPPDVRPLRTLDITSTGHRHRSGTALTVPLEISGLPKETS